MAGIKNEAPSIGLSARRDRVDVDLPVNGIQLENQTVFAYPKPVIALKLPRETPDILVPKGILNRLEFP
jgi:hypothetical protein